MKPTFYNCDCHIHMVLDGADWKRAIDRHRQQPEDGWIRQVLRHYQELGFSYLRDGGDRWGVGKRARELAGEYGIRYRTPLSPLCKTGHYGGFIGTRYETLEEYGVLMRKARAEGADFVKIMISGLMDFDRFGMLTEEGLSAGEIRELIRIAHEEGFPVMAHANGPRTVEAAARAGVDSLPSATSGEKAGSGRQQWKPSWKVPWKTSGDLPVWGACWPRVPTPAPGPCPTEAGRSLPCWNRPWKAWRGRPWNGERRKYA